MQYAEIDIIWDGGRAREVLEFRHGVGRMAMVAAVKELGRKCGWKDVRLSVGRDWTGWLLGGGDRGDRGNRYDRGDRFDRGDRYDRYDRGDRCDRENRFNRFK